MQRQLHRLQETAEQREYKKMLLLKNKTAAIFLVWQNKVYDFIIQYAIFFVKYIFVFQIFSYKTKKWYKSKTF